MPERTPHLKHCLLTVALVLTALSQCQGGYPKAALTHQIQAPASSGAALLSLFPACPADVFRIGEISLFPPHAQPPPVLWQEPVSPAPFQFLPQCPDMKTPRPQPPDGTLVTLALASGGVVTLTLIGFIVVRAGFPRPLYALWSVATGQMESAAALPAPQPHAPSAGPAVHIKKRDVIAIQYLSTPKGEDCLLTDVTPGLCALSLADGASNYRHDGKECSGGGGQAARIAAREALTCLVSETHPTQSLSQMLDRLQGCFTVAATALARHNDTTPIPGATTLILAALWQAGDGRWYWLFGNVGDGFLSVLHSRERLAGWPVETRLLTKHANGLSTITLPDFASHGFAPSVGIRPHRPGDILLLGSDGLEHLETVTKKCDRLTLPNYLYQQIQDDPARLSIVLRHLAEGRLDAPWQSALALDDTTIGLIWPQEEH